MRDPSFLDGVILGTLLLTGLFASVFMGLFLVHSLWILFLCGWPAIIGIFVVYEAVRRYMEGEPILGRAPASANTTVPRFCPACSSVLEPETPVCSRCGWRVPSWRGARPPPPKFCLACGTSLEYASRYRRGWCPQCNEYR